jgi:hypothetical protein
VSIDLATAQTSAFEAGPMNAPLLALIGNWAGPTVTWFDPESNPDPTHTTASIEAILGGRIVRAAYTGVADGKPHAGEFLFTFDGNEKRFAMAWVDSYHMGTGIMHALGDAQADGALSFPGNWQCGEERWGWRTVIRPIDANTILVQAFMSPPSGEEQRAVETRLSRV